MTQDEIIEMAKQAGASADGRLWLMYSEDLEAFAKLVAAKERDACALVADNFAMTSQYKTQRSLAEWCASSIRARNTQ